MKKPKVGETYFLVPNDFRRQSTRYVSVNKVGKEYFYADGFKFNKETFVQDNGRYLPEYSLFDSEESYNINVKAKTCMKNLVHGGLLNMMTDDEIIELHEKLMNRKYSINKNKKP